MFSAAILLRCLLRLVYIRAVWLELAATWSLLVLAQATCDVLAVALAQRRSSFGIAEDNPACTLSCHEHYRSSASSQCQKRGLARVLCAGRGRSGPRRTVATKPCPISVIGRLACVKWVSTKALGIAILHPEMVGEC
ncbi:hypothetical protein IG631_01745 [Alternaria alternata]|nr:hypothetical protein IG631_01745 [Alternaria alternata]